MLLLVTLEISKWACFHLPKKEKNISIHPDFSYGENMNMMSFNLQIIVLVRYFWASDMAPPRPFSPCVFHISVNGNSILVFILKFLIYCLTLLYLLYQLYLQSETSIYWFLITSAGFPVSAFAQFQIMSTQ